MTKDFLRVQKRVLHWLGGLTALSVAFLIATAVAAAIVLPYYTGRFLFSDNLIVFVPLFAAFAFTCFFSAIFAHSRRLCVGKQYESMLLHDSEENRELIPALVTELAKKSAYKGATTCPGVLPDRMILALKRILCDDNAVKDAAICLSALPPLAWLPCFASGFDILQDVIKESSSLQLTASETALFLCMIAAAEVNGPQIVKAALEAGILRLRRPFRESQFLLVDFYSSIKIITWSSFTGVLGGALSNIMFVVYSLMHQQFLAPFPSDTVAIPGPLSVACALGNTEMIKALLHADVALDPNSEMSPAGSPLHLAVQFGKAEDVRILLDAGADKHTSNRNQQRPRDVALNDEIRDLL